MHKDLTSAPQYPNKQNKNQTPVSDNAEARPRFLKCNTERLCVQPKGSRLRENLKLLHCRVLLHDLQPDSLHLGSSLLGRTLLQNTINVLRDKDKQHLPLFAPRAFAPSCLALQQGRRARSCLVQAQIPQGLTHMQELLLFSYLPTHFSASSSRNASNGLGHQSLVWILKISFLACTKGYILVCPEFLLQKNPLLNTTPTPLPPIYTNTFLSAKLLSFFKVQFFQAGHLIILNL